MNALTSAQMRRVDRIAVKQLKIPVLLLMDNAGRCVAEAARQLLVKSHGKKVVVLCGGGNNGGDGVVAARYLKGWGYPVKVFYLKHPGQWTDDLRIHFQIAKRCGVPFVSLRHFTRARLVKVLRQSDLLIDALLGTGTRGPLRGPVFDEIAALNASRRPVVAIDLPSGLDPDTGDVVSIAVRARLTVSMAAPKTGLLRPRARPYVGRMIIADIGIPQSIRM
jgi:hydroxyethylthiazole kinase-like uncharacterized protein yjeF